MNEKMLRAGVFLLAAFQSSQATRAAEPLLQGAGPVAQSCCYTNPRHAGGCVVEPAKGETCRSVLAFLNDPLSQGKSYCANTSIRGGWKLVKCATKK